MSSLKLAGLLVALIASGCDRFPDSDPVILSLDDQVVRRSDFERHVAQLEARGGAPLSSQVRRELLDSFLEEQALVIEARSRGFLSGPGSAEERQAAIARLLEDGSRSAPLGEEAIAAYYRDHPDEFRDPERVTLRQVVVATENEARDVRRRVQDDPKQFDLLARSASRSPEAANGGLMGTFARGELPEELERPAFALAVGTVSEVVRSPIGYHVLRVEARDPARDLTLPECRDRIAATLARQSSDQNVRQFVRGLMARAKVNHEAATARPRNS